MNHHHNSGSAGRALNQYHNGHRLKIPYKPEFHYYVHYIHIYFLISLQNSFHIFMHSHSSNYNKKHLCNSLWNESIFQHRTLDFNKLETLPFDIFKDHKFNDLWVKCCETCYNINSLPSPPPPRFGFDFPNGFLYLGHFIYTFFLNNSNFFRYCKELQCELVYTERLDILGFSDS